MFIGHYSAAFAAKRLAPELPLPALFIACQLIDLFWGGLVLLGVEKLRIIPGFNASNDLDLYFMPYTHSLSSALAWALAAAFLCWLLLPKNNARNRITAVVGLTVLSHWLLDLLVHMPDLPLWFDSAKVGLGWWNYKVFALLLELALLWMGIAWCLPLAGDYNKRYLLLGLAMSAVQVYSLLEQPDNGTAVAQQLLLTYLVLAGAAWWMHPVPFRSTRTA
ncbi:hypothetical protein ACFQUU_07165 [Herbaspirillum sp. GCM10030257]|uniref:hypothetical protein n=1 Tax=Herbaspirillum sp. GCM10030257 TaxID=3273393 RepID=UPI0036071316